MVQYREGRSLVGGAACCCSTAGAGRVAGARERTLLRWSGVAWKVLLYAEAAYGWSLLEWLRNATTAAHG